MNMTKSLILGSAAALLAMGGAQAADLPVKAKAVEYVRICSLYGAGFYYIPGTDTCIKIGGVLRVDTTINGALYDTPAMYNGGTTNVAYHNRTSDYYATRARMQLTVDTRTATEYGVVRTFGLSDWDFSETGNTSGIGSFTPENVFMQFAGFTFGKSASAFATPWHSYPGNNTINVLGGGDSVVGINNVQYTAQFGAGITGTIGLDSASSAFNRTAIANLQTAAATVGIGSVTNAYGGQVAPDIVGNIRVDQAWGLFQLSGALHDNNATYYSTPAAGGTEINGHPGSKWGGAVMAALQIKNIPTGNGDDIKMDATYSVGATHYATGISGNSNLFQFSGSNAPGAYQSVGFASITDAVYNTGSALELTTAYGFRGGFNHNWDANWSTSVFGGIGWYKYNTNAKAIYCNAFGNAVAGQNVTYTCNPDSTLSEIGLITRWTPVKNLTLSFETVWWNLDQKFTGTAVMSNAQLGNVKPTATYSFKDQNGVVADVRFQRNF